MLKEMLKIASDLVQGYQTEKEKKDTIRKQLKSEHEKFKKEFEEKRASIQKTMQSAQ